MAKVSTRADMALIQGAKAVGESMAPADLSGLDKVTKAGTDMALGALEEIRKVEQEKVDAFDAFTEAANEVELNAGALGEVLYNDTVDFAQEAKNNYLAAIKAGDQKGMMAAKKAMQQRSAFTQQHKAFITELSELQKEGDLSGAMDKDELDFMKRVLKGDYKVEKNEKGEMVFNVDGVKKTNTEFEDLYILKNYEVGKTLGELNAKVVKEPTFNRDNVKNSLIQVIPKTVKDFRASMHDDLGGGQSFKELLVEDDSLEEEIKMSLGDAGWELYAGPDGKMDPNEKAVFIDAIVNHKNPNFNLETSREIMAEKMTNVVNNKYNAYQEEAAAAAAAKAKKEDDDARLKFNRQMELEKYKQQQANLRDDNARKDLILKEKTIEFNLLDAGRYNKKGENMFMDKINAEYSSNPEKTKLSAELKDLIKVETQKDIQFIKNHVDPTLDVRHLDASEINELFRKKNGEPISRNITGEYNSESSPPEAGYYRIIQEEVDGEMIDVPVLISPGWQIDGDFLTNSIKYDRFGLKFLSGGKGSLD